MLLSSQNSEISALKETIETLQVTVNQVIQTISSLQEEIDKLKENKIARPDNVYKCQVCGYGSSSAKVLKSHMTRKHKEKDQQEILKSALCLPNSSPPPHLQPTALLPSLLPSSLIPHSLSSPKAMIQYSALNVVKCLRKVKFKFTLKTWTGTNLLQMIQSVLSVGTFSLRVI